MKVEAPIFRKELLESVVSFRFVIGSVLLIVSAVICSYVRFHDYHQRLKNYHLTLATQETFLEKYAHVNRLGPIFRPYVPPKRMSLLLGELAPHPAVFSEPRQLIDDNPAELLQPYFDFQSLVGILASLLAIVLAYDVISGERERGMLALMRSNSISIARIVIEKWLAGNLLALLPLALAVILTSIYIRLDSRVSWTAEDWIAWVIIAVVYAIYLSVFFTTGLLTSCVVKRSSVSIVTLSLLWVLLVIFIPSLSPHLSKAIKPVQPPEVVTRELERIEQERQAVARARTNELLGKGLSLGQIWASGEIEAVNKRYEEKAARVKQDFERQLANQRKLTRWISSLSPTFCMIQATSELAGIGVSGADHLSRAISEWRHMKDEAVERKVQKLREVNPHFGWDDPIDVSDVPRFVYKEQPLSSRWGAAVNYIALLVLYEIGLLVFTLLLSRRIDVRLD